MHNIPICRRDGYAPPVPSIAPPTPTDLEPVSVSLITADGRFRISREGELSDWRCRDADTLRAAFSSPLMLRGESRDQPGVWREAFFLHAEAPWLYVMLSGDPEPDLGNVVAIELSGDDGLYDETTIDWSGATALLKEVTVGAWRRGEDVVLSTDPPSGGQVRTRTGVSGAGDPILQVEAHFLVPHPAWERAARRGSAFVLQAPLNAEMVAAAGGLMAIAMASQGLRPRDAFVTYLHGEDDAHRAVAILQPTIGRPPVNPAPTEPIHPADDPKVPWLRRILGRPKASKLQDYSIVILGVGRDLVEDGDIWPLVSHLNSLKDDPSQLPLCAERYELLFEGYDDDPRDVWEIPDVRDFACAMDAEFPYWLFFLEKAGTSGLQALALCVAGYERSPSGGSSWTGMPSMPSS